VVLAPEAYGINLNPIANTPYFKMVEVKQSMDLSRVAALAENRRRRTVPATTRR